MRVWDSLEKYTQLKLHHMTMALFEVKISTCKKIYKDKKNIGEPVKD
jgi:hypothetical protein